MSNVHSSSTKEDVIKLRRNLGKDFQFFRKYYFSHYHTVDDAPFHKELSELLVNAAIKRGMRIAVAAPRNHAKSTLITLEFVIYCICYHLEDFIVIVSNTNNQAESFLTNIKFELENNIRLKEDFPEVCEIGQKPKPPRWRQDDIIAKNGIEVLALGSNQQIRSRKNKQNRPTLIILDDLEAGNTIQSAENYGKLYDYLTKSVLKAGSSITNVAFIGTIHCYGSLLSQFTDLQTHPGWSKMVYRSIISWSTHLELWERWTRIYNYQESLEDMEGPDAALKYFEQNKVLMLEGTEVLWPARFTYLDLMIMREQEGHGSFDSEMMNEPINPRDRIFNIDTYTYFDDKYPTVEDLLAGLGEKKRIFGACDPSMGKEGKRGDYSAIVSVVKDTEKGTLYIIDADVERRSPDATLEKIMVYHKIRHYSLFGFESNQAQEFMLSELTRRSSAASIYVPVKSIVNTTDKIARIQSLQPLFASGRLQLSRRLLILLEQMKYFPKGAHEDSLDALQMAVKLAMDDNGFSFGFAGGPSYPRDPDELVPYGFYGWNRRS